MIPTNQRGEKRVDSAIRTQGLSVKFGQVQALKNVSLDFSGTSLGLLGPNGAGKSTLIKTLLGMIDPDEGEASVLGIDCRKDRIRLRRRVGYVPEKDCHIPGMTAADYVTLGGELAGMRRADAIERAHEMIRFCGIGEARYRPVDGFSAGMKQRIKLAQALVHDPDLIFLDEPTNGLDPEGRILLLNVLKELHQKQNIRIIISSHLLRDVEYVCDSVIVVKQGEVVRQGTIAELKEISDRRWAIRVRGPVEEFSQKLLASGGQVLSNEGENLEVQTPESGSQILIEIAHSTGCQVRHLQRIELRLEDAFMNTMRDDSKGRS
ncbi:MAG: ABC-2 type transport system ATP-binding protein [Planctomycetota bacterium]